MLKSSIWIVLVLLILLTFNPACSTTEEADPFSVLGNWSITLLYQGGYEYAGTITFAGSNASGAVTCTVSPTWTSGTATGTGTYTVSGSTVNFTIYWPDAGYTDTCTGTTTTDNSMNGTLIETPGDVPGTWTCSR